MPLNTVSASSFTTRLSVLWSRHAIWLALLLATVLAWHSMRHVAEDSIKADARQNLSIAVNVAQHGEFSLKWRSDEAKPSSFREPLPIWVVAAYLKTFALPDPAGEVYKGPNAAHIKNHNAGWVFLGFLGCWLLIHALTGSHLGALLGSLVIHGLLLDLPHLVNTLYTELEASVLLIWCTWLLVRAYDTQQRSYWVLAGVLFGLLALTKAIFLYAAIGSLPFIALAQLYLRDKQPNRVRRALQAGLLVAAGLAVTVAPWMIRNWVHFDSLQITEGRGGWVLYKRHLLNNMTPEEYKGGFYYYGPGIFREWVEGTSFALATEDATQVGGKVSRLHIGGSEFQQSDMDAQGKGQPDRAVTYYRKASAKARELHDHYTNLGHPNPTQQADHDMQAIGKAGIRRELGAHMKVTVLLAWRGFWSFPPRLFLPFGPDAAQTRPMLEWLNLVSGLALYAVFLVGLLMRRSRWLMFAVPTMSMLSVYALLTQNMSRFTVPANPLLLMALFVLVHAGWRRWMPRSTIAPTSGKPEASLA
jgi:hypothetical protein